jgi:hypothetical protein
MTSNSRIIIRDPASDKEHLALVALALVDRDGSGGGERAGRQRRKNLEEEFIFFSSL